MRYLIALSILLLCSFMVNAQIVIIDNQGNEDCARQAFILRDGKTYIDRCYTGVNDDLSDLLLIPNEPIFDELLKLNINDFYALSGDINYTMYRFHCDYALPIAFFIKDKVIEWKRIDNCYPQSVKNYAEGIIKVFAKY